VLGHYADWQIEWLYSPGTRAAMLLAWLGAVGFVAVLGLFTRVPQPAEHHPDPASRTHDPALYWIGWLVMLAGIAESAVALRSTGGLGTLALSYGEFRATTLSTTNFQAGINTSQIGCLLALCGAGGRRWIAPLATWAPFGAGLLLLGLRTDVLVPLVSFVIVLTHRGVRFRRGVLVAGVLAALIVIPAIKAFREVGFSNRERVDWTQVSPLATLTELGGTLHATKAYVDWIAGGDEPLYGASYWAPVDRQLLARILPGREQIPAIKDSRIPARDMGDREGSIGASSTGEAYYNFGAIGPLIFYALIGALFGWLDRGAAQSAYGGALLGIAMALFFFNIRDQWLPIPGRAAVALGVLAACRTIGWLSRGPTAVSVESGACS
jgi:hypothetical protein